MSFLATILTVTGAISGLVGTFYIALPDLDFKTRIRSYRVMPKVWSLHQTRERIRDAQRGIRFTIDDRTVCYSYRDYLYKQGRDDYPNQIPMKLETGAVEIIVTYPDGSTIEVDAQSPHVHLWNAIDLAIDRKCRLRGITFAIVGAGLVVLGLLL